MQYITKQSQFLNYFTHIKNLLLIQNVFSNMYTKKETCTYYEQIYLFIYLLVYLFIYSIVELVGSSA